MNAKIAQSVLPSTVNIFVNSRCNFACKHCYATFADLAGSKMPFLTKTEAQAIIEQIAAQPLPSSMIARKITFVGGEPTLYPALPALVKFAKSLGLVTAVITNGTTAVPEYLEKFAGALDWVGLSIDGLNHSQNIQIGRATRSGQSLTAQQYLDRISNIREIGAQIKINTVVSRLNWESDFTQFIEEARPVRWKILEVTPVQGQNDGLIGMLQIDEAKFDHFVANHAGLASKGIIVVPERVETIRGSYAMISPDGRFFDSSKGQHTYSNRIGEVGLMAAFGEIAFDAVKYEGRDGNYDPFTGESLAEEVLV